ncbi:kinase [Trichonephila clavata]|uniref:Kinase n=1 Tax=Trichonephila clavata TaxID=2740835 RepID=A0A8X6HNN3_TRICU|nr:kinase [Trichonephila clavata]
METNCQDPNKQQNLPDDIELFPNQVAGHRHGQGRLGLGILKSKSGHVLKPLLEDAGRAVKEVLFYENVFLNNHLDLVLEELKSFLPVYYGIQNVNISGKNIKFLCLEDASGPFQNPSILDVKIGPITYEKGALKSKIEEQKSKFAYGEICGIRIVGMKVFDEEKQLYVSPEKTFLRQLSPDTMASALNLFLTKDKFVNCLLLCGFIHKLLKLDSWFSRQRKFIFVGSSVLFVYEGTSSFWKSWICDKGLSDTHYSNGIKKFDMKQNTPNVLESVENKNTCVLCGLDKNVCTEVLTNCNLFRVNMIDFAHCSPSEEKDTNYIIGLNKLIDYLKGLLNVHKENL